MNDRFRFRIWDNVAQNYIGNNFRSITEYMLNKDGVLFEVEQGLSDSTFILEKEDCVIEQCTGLKDNNGKLIYEGDIVRIFYDHFNGTFTEKEVVGPVKWEYGAWVVNNSLLNHAPEYDKTHLESDAVEVIGNIHENPELLEGKWI